MCREYKQQKKYFTLAFYKNKIANICRSAKLERYLEQDKLFKWEQLLLFY